MKLPYFKTVPRLAHHSTTKGLVCQLAKSYCLPVGLLMASTAPLYATPPGTALQFNGSNSYVQMNEVNLGTSDFTIEGWIKPNSTNTYIYSNRTNEAGGSGRWFIILVNPTGNKLWLSLGQSNATTNVVWSGGNYTITPNLWYHIAVVRNPTTVTMYVNGIQDGQFADVATLRDVSSGNTSTRFGGWLELNNNWYNGQIDEFRIWKVARTQVEIQSNMHKTLTGTETGLEAYYNFDEGSGTTLTDLTGHGHNGTLINSPSWTAATWNYGYPYVTTGTVSGITATTALVGGTVVDAGVFGPVTNSGICYATSASPIIPATPLSPCTTDGLGIGTYTSSLTGLTPSGVTYYTRAYATNSVGTIYSYSGTINVFSGDVTFVTANPATQTISFTSPTSGMYSGNASLSATATSGLTVTFASTTPGICTVSGSTVNYVGVGTCTITASQAGNAGYLAASPVSGNITVSPANQIITFPLPPSALISSGALTLSATGGASGNPVTFASTTVNVCSVSGTTLTMVALGTCTVTANQGGNANYNAASVSQNMMIVVATSSAPSPLPVTDQLGLFLQLDGTGTGKVTSDTGLSCQSSDCQKTLDGSLTCNPQTCSQAVKMGTTVTLTPQADVGSTFSNWGGHPDCVASPFLMDSGKLCIAFFHLLDEPLTVTVQGQGHVTDNNLHCSDNCVVNYLYGTAVTLLASPANDWLFQTWSGDCNSTGQVLMTSPKTCGATFIPDPATVDNDLDHITSVVEDAAPNHGDGNGDGIPDSQQNNVASFVDMESEKYLTLQVDKTCPITNVYSDFPEHYAGVDRNHKFLQGVTYFELSCATTQVTVYYHRVSKLYSNLKFYKFGPTVPGDMKTVSWYKYPATFAVVKIGGLSVLTATYVLRDGQLGDSTGVDGKIVDPGGVELK